jgi:hypothetical protein
MSQELASEIWSELKRYVTTPDIAEAAETLVAVLIDNDIDADDIRDAFKNDADVKRALTSYLDDADEEAEEEDYEDFEDEEE